MTPTISAHADDLAPPEPPAGMILTYNGHVWSEADMTVGRAVLVEVLVGRTMEAIAPTASVQALMAWLAVLESSTTQRDVEDITVELATLPLASLLACIVQV